MITLSMRSLYVLSFYILSLTSICSAGYSAHDKLKTRFISVPVAGNSWVLNNAAANERIITDKGITNWSDTSIRIRTWFRVEQTGEINILVPVKNSSAASEIEVSFCGIKKIVEFPGIKNDTINIGRFLIGSTGYQYIEFRGIPGSAEGSPEISEILLNGKVTEGSVSFIKEDFYFGRRGPSVHLRYELPAGAAEATWFYNEITVPDGNDVTGSYFMADGFADGYFGIQCISPDERRILFSVWSPYKTDNPGSVPEDYRIILLKKGHDVITKEFGDEGSGGQSYRKFFWKTGNTYRFLINGHPSINNSTDYTAYFYAPETGKWELIASFRRPKTNNNLKNLYSFLENFIPETGSLSRKGIYSNQWICDANGRWFEVTNASFTADATAKKGSRLDYSGGVENGAFFLRNCGFFSDKTEMGKLLSRPETGKSPQINFSELEK